MPRPKPPLSAWLIRNRKRAVLTPADIARHVDVAETTVRGWEAGRPIKPENQDALARLFGEDPPERTSTSDDSLVSAIREQTAAISALVTELRLAREREQDAAASMVRAAEILLTSQRLLTGAASTEPPVPHGSGR